MATLSLQLKAGAAIIVPFAPPLVDPAPQAQGVEGQKVQEAAMAVLQHWNKRTAHLVLEEADDLSYVSVPMERAFSVKVKYRYGGEMNPLPYPLDD